MKTKKIKILIPNATSPRNPGDQAMLDVLINLIHKKYPRSKITVHSADPHLYNSSRFNTKHTLYSWAVFKNKNLFSRIKNVTKLFLQYLLLKFKISNISIDKNLSKIIKDYRDSDLILFVGGGYLRSQKGISQFLNLYMQLMLFKYSYLFSAKKIVAPISVGPFAHSHQERLTAQILSKADLVAVREKISYTILKNYDLKNITRSSDHAFLLGKPAIKKQSSKNLILGFTIRPWLKGDRQINLEASVIYALEKFSLKFDAMVQPIIQVDASIYGEDDATTTELVTKLLKEKNISVLPTHKIKSVKDGLKSYSKLDLLLGMRMHSNIFAANQGTPFVAISYEHKHQGISEDLHMEKFCIPCDQITGIRLYNLLVKSYANRTLLKKQIYKNLNDIQETEKNKWDLYLSTN